MLWFDNQAEEAANFYVSVFKNSKVKQITHYAGEEFPEKKGQVMTVSFELDGQEFTALNGGRFQVHRSRLVRDQLRHAGGDRLLLGETHRWRREGSGMRMGRGQVRTLLASDTGKVFRRMGEGSGRAATGDARGVADEEARSRKATEGICRKVTCSISQLSTLLQQPNIKCLEVTRPLPRFPSQLSEFQPFPCRPSGDGSGEKLQALLSQREVMLQLPLHSRPQILRWTCACKVPRIFPPGFDQA